MQSKKMSIIEVLLNTAIGYFVAIATQIMVFPLFDIHTSAGENFAIGAIFTVISIVRGYFVRRLFNWLGFRK